jgi:hypothetical protein
LPASQSNSAVSGKAAPVTSWASASTDGNWRTLPLERSVAVPGVQDSTARVPPSGLNSVRSPASGAPLSSKPAENDWFACPSTLSASRPVHACTPAGAAVLVGTAQPASSNAHNSGQSQAPRGRAIMASP